MPTIPELEPSSQLKRIKETKMTKCNILVHFEILNKNIKCIRSPETLIYFLRLKYIDEQLRKRKNKCDQDEANNSKNKNPEYFSPEEAALQALPEHLRISSVHHSEEMLSNQMLSGIPEIDLGIE